MSTSLRRPDSAACDHAMRLLTANGLPLTLFADAIGVTADVAAAIAGGEAVPLWPGERDRLGLFVAILVQLEIRLGHDPSRVRAALATPLTALGERTPAEVMASDGLDGLRLVHRAAGELQLPAERGTIRYFVREAGRRQMTNRSPKITANWLFASPHSRGGRFHSSAA